jgi:hypothetical protein
MPALKDRLIVPDVVILNIADPPLPEASVADIVWLPVVIPVGTVMVAENVPDEEVVILAGAVTSVVESNFIVITLFPENPEPVTVNAVPTAPEVGDIATIDDPETLNIPDAVNVPSVADTV